MSVTEWLTLLLLAVINAVATGAGAYYILVLVERTCR